MAEPSDQSDEYFAAISRYNSYSLTGYNEIEHPTDLIDDPIIFLLTTMISILRNSVHFFI